MLLLVLQTFLKKRQNGTVTISDYLDLATSVAVLAANVIPIAKPVAAVLALTSIVMSSEYVESGGLASDTQVVIDNASSVLDEYFVNTQELLETVSDTVTDPLFWEAYLDNAEGLLDSFSSALEGIGENIGGWFFKQFNDLDPSSVFDSARQKGSPIIVDLDGDGIETIGQEAGVYFDHDKNGLAERTGWVGQDDGLLVWDRNRDGIINDGSELFGNNTELASGDTAANGYEALAYLDENADNVINAEDTSFANLRIWVDANSDGVSQQNELLTLEEAGVKSFKTSYQNTISDDGKGNTTRQISTATLADNAEVDTADVWFGVNKTDTVDRNKVPLSDELLALPEAIGFGNMRSLRQAMVSDSELTAMVTQFAIAVTSAERLALMDDIIYQWAGTQDAKLFKYGQVLDGREVATLEVFIGREYVNNLGLNFVQNGAAASTLLGEYRRLKNYIYGQLISQTDYGEAFSLLSVNYDIETDTFDIDMSSFTRYLEEQSGINPSYVAGVLETLNLLSTYSSSWQEEFTSAS